MAEENKKEKTNKNNTQSSNATNKTETNQGVKKKRKRRRSKSKKKNTGTALNPEKTSYGAKIRPPHKGIPKATRRKNLNNFDKKELEKARISFRKLLNENIMNHNKLRYLALEHARNISSDQKMIGPYAIYIRVAVRLYPERKADRLSRLIVNYLRHQVLDYDERFFYGGEHVEYSLEYFDKLYEIAMKEIVRCYPKYKYALEFGMKTKRDWKIVQKTKSSILFPGLTTGKIFGIWSSLKTKKQLRNFPY